MNVLDGSPPIQIASCDQGNAPSEDYLSQRRPRLLENSHYYSVLNQETTEELHSASDTSNNEHIAHNITNKTEVRLDICHERHKNTSITEINPTLQKTNTSATKKIPLSHRAKKSIVKAGENLRYSVNKRLGRAHSISLQSKEHSNSECRVSQPALAHGDSQTNVAFLSSPSSRLIDFTSRASKLQQENHRQQAACKQTESIKTEPLSSTSDKTANNLHMLVGKYGGQVRFTFSQNEATFQRAISKISATESGVCASLSINWIVAHSKGQDLLTKIYLDGNRTTIDSKTMKILSLIYEEEQSSYDRIPDYYHLSLKDQQILMIPPTSSKKFMDKNELFLLKRDLTGSTPSGLGSAWFVSGNEQIARGQEYDPDSLLAAILNNPRQFEAVYKSICLAESDSNHLIAVHLSEASEVTFFEPNLGEFFFSRISDFSDWFLQAYMAETTIKNGFHVMAYVHSPRPQTCG